MKDGIKGYVLKEKNGTDSLDISFLKTVRETQLCKTKDGKLWLGQTATKTTYLEHLRYVREEKITKSDIIIKFSKPVTSISFLMSHFNFEGSSGYEEIQDITILDDKLYDITSTTSFDWITGSNSGIDSSVAGATRLNKKNLNIAATWGNYGIAASGQLLITSEIPFTQITLKQRVIWGNPNGIYIDAKINYTLADSKKNQVIPKKETTHIAALHKDTETSSLEDTIAPKKDTTIVEQIINQPIDSLKPALASAIILDTISINKNTELNTNIQPLAKKEIVSKKTIPTKKRTSPKPTVAKVIPKTAQKKPTVSIASKSNPKKKEVAKQVTKTTVKPTVKKESKPTTPKKTVITKKPINKKPSKDTLTVAHNLSELTKVGVGEKIKLERVFFKQSVAELLPDSYNQLDTLVLVLKQYPKLEIEIQGHTDNQGLHEPNVILSEKRALAVKDYLISKGIAAERLTYKGFGGIRPYLGNDTEEHRRLNRRVEFMVTKR